jgi:hypothetical protein
MNAARELERGKFDERRRCTYGTTQWKRCAGGTKARVSPVLTAQVASGHFGGVGMLGVTSHVL